MYVREGSFVIKNSDIISEVVAGPFSLNGPRGRFSLLVAM